MSFSIRTFAYYSLWPSLLIVILGIVGNTFLYIIYSRLGNKTKNLSITLYYRISSLIDLFIALNWLKIFFANYYGLYVIRVSSFLCKTVQFGIEIASPISTWIQVLISLDRLLNVMYPSRYSSFLASLKFQLTSLIAIFSSTMFYFIFIIVDNDIFVSISNTSLINNLTTNSTNSIVIKRGCHLQTISFNALVWLEFAQSFIPFVFMISITISMVSFIFKSRQRFNNKSSTSTSSSSTARNKSQLRDLKFAITSISLNMLYVLMNLPLFLWNFIYPNWDADTLYFVNVFVVGLWYSYYAIGFYLQLIVNSLVRAEFFKILGRHDGLLINNGNTNTITFNQKSNGRSLV